MIIEIGITEDNDFFETLTRPLQEEVIINRYETEREVYYADVEIEVSVNGNIEFMCFRNSDLNEDFDVSDELRFEIEEFFMDEIEEYRESLSE